VQNKIGQVRFYKVKNPKKEFLCALCESPRQLKYGRYLSIKNYLQVATLSAVEAWLLFPLMSYRVVYLVFINWLLFEVIHKVLYRRELPCPYCGFDPTWYRRDVKVARRLVKDFWDHKDFERDEPIIPNNATQETNSPAPPA
jgi:hypothetical protein